MQLGESLRGTRPTDRRVPGESGTWVFIVGDMTVFAFVFATYLLARAQDPALFAEGQQHLSATVGATNTLLLLLSSLCVVAGVRATGRRRSRAAQRLFGLAALCGLGFAANKYLEYSDKISHGLTPTTNDFWTYYYILTGLHLFHLVVGLGVLAFAIRQVGKPRLTARRYAYIEGGACFWHMVDLLWIVLFPLLYLVR
ncbi:putative cytochrome c oxidase subunit 3 [Paraconexibacter sp. AEG42_29]|uniref:Cytochrome aa3 subunit 3 n=1 Tax=Paraconexibacter sp. AEG42_29 TaxID=2997339 RepID=A0AAU7APP6_9ACTN